jgi:hypothetical protein
MSLRRQESALPLSLNLRMPRSWRARAAWSASTAASTSWKFRRRFDLSAEPRCDVDADCFRRLSSVQG